EGRGGDGHGRMPAGVVALGVREDLAMACAAGDAALDAGHGGLLQVGNELVQVLLLTRRDLVHLAELTLPLRALLGEDVAAVALGVPQLAGRGALEALGRATMALHLRHELRSLLAAGSPPPRPR